MSKQVAVLITTECSFDSPEQRHGFYINNLPAACFLWDLRSNEVNETVLIHAIGTVCVKAALTYIYISLVGTEDNRII